MKILEVLMLFYQYAYYLMRIWDKRAGMSASFTQFKAFSIFGSFQALALVTVYGFVYHTMPGPPIHKISSSTVVTAFAIGLVLCFMNQRIIGSENRIHHYKEIFDAWDKNKRTRWTIYVISIAVSTLVAFLLVAEISLYGLNLKKWN